ncbi:hypothetical protein PMAYCL1PPCAC_03632, partial [Pristionchus mayeri]
NHVYTLQAYFSAQTASLIAYTGYIFAHEFYHQVQNAFKEPFAIIEDITEHVKGKECVIRYMDRVCSRFTEKACSSKYTENEDGADVFGAQIAFRVLQQIMGDNLDEIVFPDLN